LTLTVDDWDAEPMSLNCDGSLVRLDGRYPAIRNVRAGDYVTKTCAAQPGGDCPLWLEFLEVVTDGDGELIGFLQRMCGYCLTGSTEEQVVFFLWGPGGNGKSTFINTITGIMGDYAKVAPMNLLDVQNNDRASFGLAGLQGARLVTMNETAEGRRWDEARLKQLTGGERINAEFKYKDAFEYLPAFKLVISGNHKPELRGIDDALKRRVVIVPFVIKIPEQTRIRGFDKRLKTEWPGILAWMIRGVEAWRDEGLKAPAAVNAMTEDYFETEDIVGAWVEECTVVDADRFEATRDLFESWKAYCSRSGEHYGTSKHLVNALKKRGELKGHKRVGIRGFLGRRIRSDGEVFAKW
jgi:putative DNA primase/helicase